jgi:hypothetical protein
MGNDLKVKFRGVVCTKAEIAEMIKPLEDDYFESEILGNEAVKKWKSESNFKINDQMDMLELLD